MYCPVRLLFGGFLFFCAPLFAGSVLSLQSTSTAAGMPLCESSDATSVSCSAVSSVMGITGQPTAGIVASMNLTGSGVAWHLAGNASVYQNFPVAGASTPFMQTSLTMTALIDLPADSGNWVVSGINLQGENQQPQINAPVQVNGNSITSRDERFPTTFTILHDYGAPLQVSIVDHPLIFQTNSGEGLFFSLDFLDPLTSTPEPATWILTGGVAGVLLSTMAYKRRK